MKLSKLLKEKDLLNIPELKGKLVCYQKKSGGEVLAHGEKKITDAAMEFPENNLLIRVWGEVLHIYNYKDFFEGEQSKHFSLNMQDFAFFLKEPLQGVEYIEKEIKRQKRIRKILKRWYNVRCFFKPILPALLFILKCITLAIILKLIL